MDVKKAIGLCGCKGCFRKAKAVLKMKNKNDEVKSVQVCQKHAWQFYFGEKL